MKTFWCQISGACVTKKSIPKKASCWEEIQACNDEDACISFLTKYLQNMESDVYWVLVTEPKIINPVLFQCVVKQDILEVHRFSIQ